LALPGLRHRSVDVAPRRLASGGCPDRVE
jgi:hypothetical protein